VLVWNFVKGRVGKFLPLNGKTCFFPWKDHSGKKEFLLAKTVFYH